MSSITLMKNYWLTLTAAGLQYAEHIAYAYT
jgi:hypothetical protein